MTLSGEDVKAAMIAAGITRVDHHRCGICQVVVAFVRQGGQLYFDPRCNCVSGLREPRTWQEAADWINMQTPEIAVKIAGRFGLLVTKEPESN